MLNKIFVWILAAMLAFSNVGCTSVPQPTMEELLEEVNAEHAAVEQTEGDFSQYLRKPVQKIQFDKNENFTVTDEAFDPTKQLTIEQAKGDIDYFFNIFHDTYGLYDYFGGDEVFTKAKQAVIEECESAQTLTCEVLEQSLIDHFSFVKDGHFSINQKYVSGRMCPFFYREVSFVKTEEGYQTTDGKKVESIEGYENLDELMKRSISPEGKLVYYPVLLKEMEGISALDDSTYSCEEKLTVHYQDGETQTLEAEPFTWYWEEFSQNVQTEKVNGTPILRMNFFDQTGAQERSDFIKENREEPIMIMDMRSNGGGYWLEARNTIIDYTGKNVTTNAVELDAWTGTYTPQQDVFLENNNLLIVLTGKQSASSAEQFLDALHNVENVLIIGENTNGCIISSGGQHQLPNSKAQVILGSRYIHLFPSKEYFEELKGMEPDIWVPAGEAEELAVKLIENLK